ncbi:hypothetical protein GLOIN_2v1471201 [Rhizophagus clarus]|uniref:Reverse transcriptase domain-containing protein n=1 Tax=Rhizophagus clarus TaxID=94130 RepID=A0A8H3LH25_9GLOM|nr:hypothetical protein GLOIN_2v1471201 [Rhizophagus clarus]
MVKIELCLDPDVIDKEVTNHFQNAADWIDSRWRNHATLPGGSTEVPIRIINLIMEDAKVNKNPLWILFQDLSKAYNRVDIKMLEKAVITTIGTTQFYKAFIGIDQDPDKETIMIFSQAYMDDDLRLSKVYIFNQCKNIITGYNKIIRNKQLTDKMMRYIYNTVIIPSIEYKSQHIILNDKQVLTCNTLACTLFKKKTNLVMTIPNCMIHSSLGYAIKDISTIQLQRQVTRLQNQLQNKGLLGISTKGCKPNWYKWIEQYLRFQIKIPLIQALVLIQCTGYELKDIQSRSKGKQLIIGAFYLLIRKRLSMFKAQSIQDAYILDSSVFEYIAMIENRIKYNTRGIS